jgi:OOP family OmpA-OmpF porin
LVDYQASEVLAAAQAQLCWNLSGRLQARWNLQLDYLTGLGAEFSDSIMDIRDDILVGSMISLTWSFGGQSKWRSQGSWTERPEHQTLAPAGDSIDGDGDGVRDEDDACPGTPVGVAIDTRGCPLDSDQDGVLNGLDDCPDTDLRARNAVDVTGCPIDSDYDGVADYMDACPYNVVGAIVDQNGCPLDSDKDGVPDGLDDCPNSLVGVQVDRQGCIDLSMLDAPMVLNIDYISGSFEVDPRTQERLRQLARLLVFVTDVKLEISGYTDNIGTSGANQQLSEKRARRVRDYLVSLGVAADRIKAYGRGEASFVASNDTADGRARNRRVEIVFYR